MEGFLPSHISFLLFQFGLKILSLLDLLAYLTIVSNPKLLRAMRNTETKADRVANVPFYDPGDRIKRYFQCIWIIG